MAIYQFTIELIPSAWTEKNKNSAIDLLVGAEGYDTSIAWQPAKSAKSVEPLLSNIMPSKEAWHENLRAWGNEESNDIQLWVENGNIDSLKIRFDLRNDTEDLKIKVIDCSKKLSCDIFIPDTKEIIKPDIDALSKVISKSSAARFVENPEKFFNEKI
ncbi:MAG: hypothetical protein ACD_46C00070G0002 [uncultured bacterium]|nr:MAG: hypothetical protein ACD_46C00070G0002 [uncultured bacterium]